MRSRCLPAARIAFACVLCAAAGMLAWRARNGVETDLYSLADTRHGGVLREIADGMAGQGRILLEGESFEEAKAAAADARERFAQPPSDFRATLRFLASHKAGLLSAETREMLLEGRYADVSAAALARLYGFAPPLVSVKDDPFLLTTDWVMSLQGRRAAGWSLRDGELARETNGVSQILLTLDISRTPARDVADFLAEAEKGGAPVRKWCGGPPFHSARATANATREINLLSAASLALVILFGWLLFRSFRFVLPLVATLGAASIVAAAALFAAFPRPHVLTFVFGTSLIGLAVDYVYHTRAVFDPRAVLRPLSLSLLTSEACLAPLLFSVVPVLRQMALFTGVGLLAAFAWAVAWAGRRAPEPWPGGVTASAPRFATLRLLLVAIAAIGLFRLRVSSDPANLYTPDCFLVEGERRLAACNPSETGRFVLVRGRTVQEALEREEAAGIQGLSVFIPSLKRQRENCALVARLHEAEGTAYRAKTGLAVPPPKEGPLLDPDDIADPRLAQLARTMVVSGGVVSPCPDGFSSDDPNIVVLEPKKVVADLFAAFSSATMRLLGASLAVLAALLALVFRWRSVGYMASIAATFAATAGMLGWLGVPVTFFTMLCFFAVAGLGLDYAIFSRSSSGTGVRRTVFYAFLTSFAGLGMLSFTDFAVTRSMGVTFACGLFFAWLCAGMFSAARPAGREPPDRASTWHRQREQSAGRFRMLFMWYAYAWFGKTFQKLLCVPVMLFIYPFARPAREALREFYGVMGIRAGHWRLFRHMLGFAWSLADKTDACSLRKCLPRMSVRDDEGWRAFSGLVAAGKGAFLMSTHLGTIEVLPALGGDDAPHVHAFQQMGHDAVFTRVFARHLDTSRLTLHPVEEIGVETAVQMQEAIGRGELVLMAGDRVSAGSGRVLEREFLGRRCVWPKGVFVFAKLMEAPVFFVVCVCTGWNAYEVHVRECPADARADERRMLSSYAAFLEDETRANPGQWYQFYRFFA